MNGIKLFKILQMGTSFITIMLGIHENSCIIIFVGLLGIVFAYLQYVFENKKEKKDDQHKKDIELRMKLANLRIKYSGSTAFVDTPYTRSLPRHYWELVKEFKLYELLRLWEINSYSNGEIDFLENHTNFTDVTNKHILLNEPR